MIITLYSAMSNDAVGMALLKNKYYYNLYYTSHTLWL